VYMIDFDSKLKEILDEVAGKYYRYCDDILCIFPVDENMNQADVVMQCDEYKKSIEKVFEDYKLIINQNKTEMYSFKEDSEYTQECLKIKDDGTFLLSRLQYLGFKFNGQKKLIRSSSLNRYHKKYRRGIKYDIILKNKHDYNGFLKKKKIRFRYSHVGKNNFPRYIYRCSELMKDEKVKRQISKHQKQLDKAIETISSRIKDWPHSN
jgi:RNA-directed DNA polymerase